MRAILIHHLSIINNFVAHFTIQTMNTKFLLLGLALFFTLLASAQNDSTSNDRNKRTSVGLSKEIINPSTLLWQVQLEDKIITKFSDNDGMGNKFRLRLIIPIKRGLVLPYKQLIRVISYFNTLPQYGSGMANTTLNQFWILSEKDWGNWGLGYNLQIPTAKNIHFGSPQWSIGPAFTITFSHLGNWEMYYIVQNFFSISENDTYGSKANMVFQPNIFYTWSSGLYTGIEPLWQYDFKTGGIDFPLNWRLGYIFQSKKFKYNAYVEPEWKTYRSDDYFGNNEDFAVKLGFRIFLPE